MKFSNLETTLVAKWLGSQIETIVNESTHSDKTEIQAELSEKVENLIKEELSLLSEGYISDIIHQSFEHIQYDELITYFQGKEGKEG